MATTSHYGWPLLATNQANPEVTHNDAISDIDAELFTLANNAINVQTGTSYSALLADANNTVTMNNASASTFTIASGIFAVGTVLTVIQLGAGQITLTASGVTINTPSSLTTRAQYSTVSVIQVATNVWVAAGDLT